MPPLAAIAAFALAARPALRRLLLLPYVAGTELPNLSGSRAAPLQFGRDHLDDYRSELLTALEAFRYRLWLFRSVVILARAVLLAACCWLLGSLLQFAGLAEWPVWLSALTGLALLSGLALAYRQRLSYFEVARVVDRQLGLKAQLGTAVQLSTEGEPGAIARSQVRQATAIARRLEPGQAIAFRGPWSDLRLLAAVAACALALTFVASLGLRANVLERPATAADLDALDPAALKAWYEVDPAAAASLTTGGERPGSLQTAIDDLKRRLDQKEITPQEYAAQVAALEDQIRQQAEESSRQQAALTDLAHALKDTSATRSVAENLNAGNYSQAVQDLAQLGQSAGQLSASARAELANQLAQAAQQTAPNSPQLSGAAQQAANALRQGDAGAAQQALRDLASAVADASQAITPQADLAQAMQDLQAQGAGASASGADQAAGSGAPTSADSPGSPTGDSGSGAGPGKQPGDGAPGAGRGADTGGESSSNGGGAGSGAGQRIVPNGAQAGQPAATGNVLQITGKPSNTGASVRTDGPGNLPLTSASGGAATVQGSGGQAASAPVTAVGENNYVPLEKKSVVKDYFSSSGGQ